MVRLLGVLFLLPCFVAAQEKQAAPTPAYKVLKAPDLEKLLAEGEKYLILDVRRPDEISKLGTVKGYINIPVEVIAERYAELPKDKPIISLCNRARRATTAADLLKEKGYTIAAVGGLEDIKTEEGGPKLITVFPPAPPEEKKPEAEKK